MRKRGIWNVMARSLGASALTLAVGGEAQAELTLRIQDFATAPKTGATGSAADPITFSNSVYLSRINFLAEEPGVNRNRMFVNDLNGPLYILDKTTKSFTEYLNFNGRGGLPGMYQEFVYANNFAAGLITFQFDPDYANNGKFYTIHMEEPSVLGGENGPQHTVSYDPSGVIGSPGNGARQTVLVEWTDSNQSNSTFEGTAREVMRLEQLGNIHPMGDIIFNPTATPGSPDWRMMYIAIGDGGAGESASNNTRPTPQMLSALAGKVLRIRPDAVGAATALTPSLNGRYHIPADNPFVSMSDSQVRDEIFALGFRNPHRLSWDVDPANPANNALIVNDIGLNVWEEVNIVHAGANYGYSQREGNQVLVSNNVTGPLPSPDQSPVYITSTATTAMVAPTYPVVQYGHGRAGQPGPEGDSISSGYVYRGSNIPSLYGKYIFGDITTGQIFWSDFAEMQQADDGNPATLAAIHQIDLLWDNPHDSPDQGEALYTVRTPDGDVFGPMFDIVEKGYEARGGTDPRLPGSASVTGFDDMGDPHGRADIRIQADNAGELYIISKSDGMIRYIVEAAGDADFNNDGRVDGGDFVIWQRNLGSAGGLAQGDADGDGRVTTADIGFWTRQHGMAPPAAAAPEPSAWAIVAAALGAALVRRRRSP
ncbi:MAG TPA: PQQ-dependent sugar dehydrogenase [Lacipirellulaceae bacterium]|nr:PQQ-dependent sugar dehydrogenase [Lacipirellulaceae bacterium]